MGEAMRNERLAVRQKLADAYRVQLTGFQNKFEQNWQEMIAELVEIGRRESAPVAFARAIRSGRVDAVLVFDERGGLAYPNVPQAAESGNTEPDERWAEAGQIEFLRQDLEMAAGRYAALARESTNANLIARALQAQARCLVRGDRTASGVRVILDELGGDQFRQAVDPQGRLIAANAELMVLELLTNHSDPDFETAARRLAARLQDYGNPALAAPQRRFLMRELHQLAPARFDFPLLAAEDLAAQVAGRLPAALGDAALRRSPVTNFWQFVTPDHRVMALVGAGKLRASAQAVRVREEEWPGDVTITLMAPGIDHDAAFVSLPAGPLLPGWQIALTLHDQTLFDTTSEHRLAVYLWTGILVLATMGVFTLLAIRLLRRQMALARLKNDLAATVSHELKTPLSGMRVLVDTLLDSPDVTAPRVREYLQLIAHENERLSRVIQNFLTFSRMEKKKYSLHFAAVPVPRIVETAVAAVRERFAEPGCEFKVVVPPELPHVRADADALATALINLLENAFKYSEGDKRICLQVQSLPDQVLFSVRDNGIGIPASEHKRIFQNFYQVDQRLSRQGGGCGLGLSIVRFIVNAHEGRVAVQSRPGAGSTFTITIPAVAPAATIA